jgi:hypothetical protein
MVDDDLAKQRRFLLEVEQGVRMANREIIHQRIPELSTENILPFAVSVARLRARYLEAAFNFSEKEHGDPLDDPEIETLRHTREMYEEARDAFEALRHAIDRGYVDLKD